MENIGAEGNEGWERGVGWREGDLEAEDGGGVGSCLIPSVRGLNSRVIGGIESIATLSNKYYARPEC
jgi:hypothetical protein